MTLSVAVMAHPSRAAMVDDLVARLDRPVEVVWDQINDRHDTGIRSIEAFDPAATHHLVIQDDVLPCRDLIAGAERAMAHVPDGHPASLYVGRVRPFAAAVERAVSLAPGSSWITMQGIYWGPAIIVPTECIPNLAKWYRAKIGIRNYDKRVSRWFEDRGLPCWYSWPSLVEHRGTESLAHPDASAARKAHRFIGENESAMNIDWSNGIVDVPRTSRLDLIRQRGVKAAAR